MTDRQWVEEDRPEIVERIEDGMDGEYTHEQLRQYVWDSIYDQNIFQEWVDRGMHAERYAPELMENGETE